MQTKSLLKKGLLCGIVVLLVGIIITPIVSSCPIEKYNSVTNLTPSNNSVIKTGLRGLNITFNGTMGENGWYVSPVEIIIVFENDSYFAHFYYQIDNGNLTEYTPPVDDVWVNEDGIYCFYGYFTDSQGNIEKVIGPFNFKIDQTPPDIAMSVTRLNLLGTKWLLNATVSDATSGVYLVEFYVDDVLVGNATAFPYIFVWAGGGKTAQAIAYDCAGNNASSSISTPCIQSRSSPILQQKTMLFQHLIYNLLLHPQMKGRNQ